MFRFARRPSPALIVSCCSLFVALGGTSYALTAGSIGTREIRDNSIRGADVRNGTLTSADVKHDALGGRAIDERGLDASQLGTVPDALQARTAVTADHATSASTAESAGSADGIRLQAFVNADGGRLRARGITQITKRGTGQYMIAFDRDVTGCVPAVTLQRDFLVGIPGANGSGTGEIAVDSDPFNDDHRLFVVTADSAGNPQDRGFDVIVSC
jgi:hypothetical protein